MVLFETLKEDMKLSADKKTWLPAKDDFFYNKSADYELPIYQYIMSNKNLKSKKLALDVGAHVGIWSRRLMSDFEYVHAFEPLPVHYNCLVANTATHSTDIIKTYNVALSDKSGVVNMQQTFENSGQSKISDDGELEIKCVTLDSLSLEPGFIKIDVEGHEDKVLMGSIETLSRNKPVMMIEIWDKNTVVLLDKIGFKLERSFGSNCVFVSK
jgi:FkbM family methyltransferase